jgi:hypothetical protein
LGIPFKNLNAHLVFPETLTRSVIILLKNLLKVAYKGAFTYRIRNIFKDFFQIVSECPQTRIMGFLHFLESKTSKGLLETCVLNKTLVFLIKFKKNRLHMYFEFIETRKSGKKASN